MAYAYMFNLSVDEDEILHFELKGGDPKNPKMDFVSEKGEPRNGASISTFLFLSERVPNSLLVSVPKRIIVKPGRKGLLADFGFDATYGCFIVSDRVVDVIESLEPGVHEFLPIAEAVDTKGEPLPRKYFLMNVLTRLAPIDVARSTVHIKDTSFTYEGRLIKSEMLAENPGPLNTSRLVADRVAIGGAHLWRGDRYGLMGRYYCTVTLRRRLEEAGISPLNYYRALD